MIEQWQEERRKLLAMHAEQHDRRMHAARLKVPFKLNKGETLVTEADIEALGKTPVTAAELKKLRKPRGQYRKGDTRAFVENHEALCAQYNCWMVRDKKGGVRLLSEHPDKIAKRAERHALRYGHLARNKGKMVRAKKK